MQPVGFFLNTLIVQSPILLVWLVGFVIAVARWRKHPKVSALTIAALVLYFLGASGNTLASRALTGAFQGLGLGMPSTLMWTAVRLGLAAVKATAWALMLVAVFAWRSAWD